MIIAPIREALVNITATLQRSTPIERPDILRIIDGLLDKANRGPTHEEAMHHQLVRTFDDDT